MTKRCLKNLPLRERPVYRVTEGSEVCNLVELLAAIAGGPEQIEIAYALLERFGDLRGLMETEPVELQQVDGVGPATAARLRAAMELGRRFVARPEEGDQRQLSNPAAIGMFLVPQMSHLERENFVVLCLDSRLRVIHQKTLYVGTIDATRIRSAEIFCVAIKHNAAAVAIAHNHPSGDPSPSPEDVKKTREIVKSGRLLDVEVLDHIIIGHSRYCSLRERGYWPKKEENDA